MAKYDWKELSEELEKKIDACFEMPFSEEIVLDRIKKRLF